MSAAAASSLVDAGEIERRLDAPRACYNSPSSISDVDTSSSTAAEAQRSPSCADFCASPVPGELRRTPDGMSDPAGADSDDINGDVARTVSSSSSARKRKLSDVADEADGEAKKPKPCLSELTSAQDSLGASASVPEASDRPEEHPSACDGYEYGESTDGDYASASTDRRSRRTLYIEYWSRTDECKERKWDHLDEIADKYGSAEEHIFATTLNNRTAFLEPNMFPYDTPAGIEHWTLWHLRELSHEQIKQYVENWIDANAPHVERWNYDDNPERSIDIFHVHVYLQVPEGMSVLMGRRVEDLVHELD